MCAQKSFSVVFDKRHERGFLFVIHRQLTGCVKHHGVEIVDVLTVAAQFFLGEQLGIGADERIPQARLLPDLPDGGQAV